ncbi:hypothetical protein [Larkinella soli]|uniref:hypothetical protein n=1 Tax=Larkinella soli TaxID=1770527 RepID=UPI000FFB55AB|nr:hypothetical protein [Larkinella soli]
MSRIEEVIEDETHRIVLVTDPTDPTFLNYVYFVPAGKWGKKRRWHLQDNRLVSKRLPVEEVENLFKGSGLSEKRNPE